MNINPCTQRFHQHKLIMSTSDCIPKEKPWLWRMSSDHLVCPTLDNSVPQLHILPSLGRPSLENQPLPQNLITHPLPQNLITHPLPQNLITHSPFPWTSSDIHLHHPVLVTMFHSHAPLLCIAWSAAPLPQFIQIQVYVIFMFLFPCLLTPYCFVVIAAFFGINVIVCFVYCSEMPLKFRPSAQGCKVMWDR